jgi:hypothetical protein
MRYDANGPAAIDVTIRHPLAPSRNRAGLEDIGKWHEEQERDKIKKYGDGCQRRGWTFIPFVLDCYGGMGDGALTFVGNCIKLLAGQHDAWERRGVEGTCWQGISMTLAREVGRQLVWGQCPEELADHCLPEAHKPYCTS